MPIDLKSRERLRWWLGRCFLAEAAWGGSGRLATAVPPCTVANSSGDGTGQAVGGSEEGTGGEVTLPGATRVVVVVVVVVRASMVPAGLLPVSNTTPATPMATRLRAHHHVPLHTLPLSSAL